MSTQIVTPEKNARSAELAAFLAPIHVGPDVRTLWVAHGTVVADDGGKVGCRSLTTLHRADLPAPTLHQRIAFAILAAQQAGGQSSAWSAWAEKWLSGTDRTVESAAAAELASRAAARAAAEARKVDLDTIAKRALAEF